MKHQMSKAINNKKYIYFTISILLLLGVFVLFSFFYYRSVLEKDKIHEQNHLITITELKAKEFYSWYNDELLDANIIANNSLLVNHLNNYLLHGNVQYINSIKQLLVSIKREHDYKNVTLISANDYRIFVSTDSVQTNFAQVEAVERIENKLKVISTPVYLLPQNKNKQIDFISSVVDVNNNLLGYIIFSIDINEAIFNNIKQWPFETQSGQFYVLSKNGNSYKILNDSIRFFDNFDYTNFTESLSTLVETKETSSSFFIIKNKREDDYYAFVSAVSDSDYFIASTIKRKELLGNIHKDTVSFFSFILLLAILVFLIFGVIYIAYVQKSEKREKRIIEEERRKLYTLMSNLPGMAYRCKNDSLWTMEFVSQGCVMLTGYPVQEIVNNAVIAYGHLILPEDREFVEKGIERALKQNRSFEFEYRIKTKTGEVKWVWERGSANYSPQGDVLSLEGFISDIHERRTIELALEESENKYQTLTEHSSVGVFQTDAYGSTTYVNPKWCELAGISGDLAMGYGWLNAVHPDDRERVQGGWSTTLNDPRIGDDTYRFVHPDGKVVWVKGQALPEYDNQNIVVGYIGTITDITDSVEAEEQIKYTNNLLNTIIENLPDAVYMKDTKGRKLIANKADIDNMGVKSKAEVIGKTDFDIFPEDIAKGFWDNDKYVLETGQSIIDKVEILKNKNNKTKYLQTSKIPVKNEKGKVIGLVGVGHDVTERTMLMEQLLVAKEKAEESDRLKTSFLANMSHEIRTPLNSILGFTDLMTTDDTNDEEKEQYSEIIKKSADSLLHIINDIIDISSLETGQMKIIPEKFSINSLLKMLNLEYKAKVIEAGKPDIEIITHMANPDVELYLDKNRVNQILINLIGNALKFTEKGFIEFGVVDVDQKYIYFKVKDTGTGIPEQMYDVIFERFRQLNDNSTRNVGGNGLGLSIVKNLVNIMGGEIRVESEQVKGSSFYFYLSQTLESKK